MIPRDVHDVNGTPLLIKDPIPRRDAKEIDLGAVVRIELSSGVWLGTRAQLERLYTAIVLTRAEIDAVMVAPLDVG